MFLYFETIALIDGKLRNIDLHIDRMKRTILFHHGIEMTWNVNLKLSCIQINSRSKIRVKVMYGPESYHIDIESYKPVVLNQVIVKNSNLDYKCKYVDRSKLNELNYNLQRDCEVLVVRNGYITDCLKYNIILKKSTEWYTPETFLLDGTMRTFLLQSGLIKTASISIEDIHLYESFKLINAMNDFDESSEYPIKMIQIAKS
ncbi:MAG TPA: aminotransferase class IV [Saprospiraceae bacterium]|nr:aminotransferase class IV [Saprospiraceae bacterium]